MCSTRECFDSIRENSVRNAGKEIVKAIDTGTITLNIEIDEKLKLLKLLDVLYTHFKGKFTIDFIHKFKIEIRY